MKESTINLTQEEIEQLVSIIIVFELKGLYIGDQKEYLQRSEEIKRKLLKEVKDKL
jgi:hypothetical protein